MSLTAKYLGDHRVECAHDASGDSLITQAPGKDGSESTFTPTDLVGAALVNCAFTIMSFLADRHGIDLSGAWAKVNKEMASDPSRISRVEIVFHMPNRAWTEKEKEILMRAAEKCPVHKSLAPDMEQVFVYRWGNGEN